jgi:hypothetical protein
MTEHDEQVSLFDWAAWQKNLEGWEDLDYMFAIPNGGWRAKSTGKWLKAEGLKPGVPDACLPVPRGQYAGLWIEMKFGGNTPTNEQKNYLAFLSRQGYYTCICQGATEAIEVIEWYWSLKGDSDGR